MKPKLTLTLLLLLAVSLSPSCAPDSKQPESLADLSILSRADWGANAPVAEMKQHTPARITIHHTATKQNPDRTLADKLRGLQKFSQNEGKLASGKTKPPWPDVPYHYYIDCKGSIAEGRDVNYAGDTNTEYDPTGHALIVLEGNFEEEQPTPEQLESLRQLTRRLMARWTIPATEIAGHKDFAQTQCPGARLQEYLPELRKAMAK